MPPHDDKIGSSIAAVSLRKSLVLFARGRQNTWEKARPFSLLKRVFYAKDFELWDGRRGFSMLVSSRCTNSETISLE